MPLILVIDDEAGVREFVRIALEKAGFEVKEAAGGEEGINFIRKNPVDLVITDIVMPDKGGIEILIDLRRDFPNLKAIVMSGKVNTESDSFQQLVKHFGAAYILQKPFEIKELLKAVQDVLND